MPDSKRKRTLIPLLAVMCAVFTISHHPLHAESFSISEPAGFHTYIFVHGWNLISLPVLGDPPFLQEMFGTQITGSADFDSADVVYSYDPDEEIWVMAWLDETGVWTGDFALDSLKQQNAYWVLIRPSSPDTQFVTVMGQARDEFALQRGRFAPGVHLLGGIWAGSLGFGESGLQEAGVQHGNALVQIEPSTGEFTLLDQIMAYDTRRGWYLVAWFDGENWRGDMDAFVSGRGYMLFCGNELQWDFYPRPDLTDFGTTMESDVQPIQHHRAIMLPGIVESDPGLPPLPPVLNRGSNGRGVK